MLSPIFSLLPLTPIPLITCNFVLVDYVYNISFILKYKFTHILHFYQIPYIAFVAYPLSKSILRKENEKSESEKAKSRKRNLERESEKEKARKRKRERESKKAKARKRKRHRETDREE
jgi:hypothetical protein